MKDIERIFKEQLNNYELPYEPGAWEALSKRLDGTPSTPFYRKWWFAASVGTVLVGSATFFALSTAENKQETARTEALSKTQDPSGKATASSAVQPSGQASAALTEETTVKAPAVTEGESKMVISQNPPSQRNQITQIIQSITEPDYTASGSTKTMGDQSAPSDSKLNPIIVPSSVCINEAITVENPNNTEIYVKLPGGIAHIIPGKKSLKVTATEAGIITLRSGRLNETITVNSASSNLYMNVDASVLYENGIPTVKFEINGAENEVSWESNIASKSIDKNKLIVHPFKEKQVVVTASSTDQNGCVVTESKTITMEDNYNLIAMEAFRPLGDIAENKLFMPYALTLREAPFELTIFDPKTGAPVYMTNDASRGWDGTDSRKGEMVTANSIWSWKVVMKNPLPGEPHIYTGTVTRL